MSWFTILKNFKVADWTDEEIRRLTRLGNELGLKIEGPNFKVDKPHRAIHIEFSTNEIKGYIQKRGKDERSFKEAIHDVFPERVHYVPTSIEYFVYTGWEKNIEGINSTHQERYKTQLIEGARHERKVFESLDKAINFIKENVKLRMGMLGK
jgi:hypothetical protein